MSKQAKFKLFSNVTIEPGANIVSQMVPVEYSTGYFAVNGAIQGTNPNLKLEYLTGDGTDFVPGGTPIKDSLRDTPFGIQFYPEFGEFIKIKATNNSASLVSITLSLIFSEK